MREPTRTLYERSKSAINRRFCYKCMRAILPISENSSFSALCIEKAAFKPYNRGIEKFLINFFRSEIFGYAKRTICIEDLNASWKEAYPVDDASIMDLFRKRDEKAIAEMKRKYDKLCYYVAGKILSQREDIEECVNSAYYEIWNNIPPDSPNDLKTYLCRIVRNIAIKRLHYNTAAKRNPEFTVPIDEIAECVPTTAAAQNGRTEFITSAII